MQILIRFVSMKLTGTFLVDGKVIERDIVAPSNWSEVTFKKYAELVDEGNDIDIIKQISILTGEDYDNLMQMEYNVIQMLTHAIRFSFDTSALYAANIIPDDFENWKNPKEGKIQRWDIGLQPVQKMIIVDQAHKDLQEAGKKFGTFFLCEELCRQYAGVEIADKPITEVLGLCNFFLSSYLNLKRGMSISIKEKLN